MGHSVSKAADNAVEKSKKVKAADRTDLQILADIRRNFAAGLAVTADDQKWLLVQYDERGKQISYWTEKVTGLLSDAEDRNTQIAAPSAEALISAHEGIEQLKALDASQRAMIVDLQTKLQEFRDVYEQENRSTIVKVERVLGEPVDCVGIAKTVLGITDVITGAVVATDTVGTEA